MAELNLQNFPRDYDKNEDINGIDVRAMITAPKGHWLVSFDYGQLEARVIAMASNDEAFCNEIRNGLDTHMYWANRIVEEYPEILAYTVPEGFRRDIKVAAIRAKKLSNYDELMGKFRKSVKNLWVFPAFYGALEESVSGYFERDYCKIPEHIMHKLYTEFWETYKGVKKWQEELLKFYNKYGYVESLTGRRRRLPLTPNEIYNFPVQSTASYDICICAGDRLSELAYSLKKLQYQYILQIHDDLSFTIPEATLWEDIKFIANEMTRKVYDFINVPLTVECNIGLDWRDMEKVGEF